MIYAESSALLSWLLGEDRGDEVAAVLQESDGTVVSDLTLLESRRVLTRYVAGGVLTEADAAGQQADLAKATAGWTVLRLGEEVMQRAARPFPVEPVRTMDALHLAAALFARSAVAELRMLSLDHRIRENAEQLGLEVVP